MVVAAAARDLDRALGDVREIVVAQQRELDLIERNISKYLRGTYQGRWGR